MAKLGRVFARRRRSPSAGGVAACRLQPSGNYLGCPGSEHQRHSFFRPREQSQEPHHCTEALAPAPSEVGALSPIAPLPCAPQPGSQHFTHIPPHRDQYAPYSTGSLFGPPTSPVTGLTFPSNVGLGCFRKSGCIASSTSGDSAASSSTWTPGAGALAGAFTRRRSSSNSRCCARGRGGGPGREVKELEGRVCGRVGRKREEGRRRRDWGRKNI